MDNLLNLNNLQDIIDGMTVYMPSGIQATLKINTDGNIVVIYPNLSRDEYTQKDFESLIGEGIRIFHEPSQKIMECKMNENKMEILGELERIAKTHPDPKVRQYATSLLDALNLQVDAVALADDLIQKVKKELHEDLERGKFCVTGPESISEVFDTIEEANAFIEDMCDIEGFNPDQFSIQGCGEELDEAEPKLKETDLKIETLKTLIRKLNKELRPEPGNLELKGQRDKLRTALRKLKTDRAVLIGDIPIEKASQESIDFVSGNNNTEECDENYKQENNKMSRLDQLKEELEGLLSEMEQPTKELKEEAEPKRFIVNSIGEGDDIDQQEFDNLCSAVDAFRALKDTRKNEIVDTKTEEILCSNHEMVESVNEDIDDMTGEEEEEPIEHDFGLPVAAIVKPEEVEEMEAEEVDPVEEIKDKIEDEVSELGNEIADIKDDIEAIKAEVIGEEPQEEVEEPVEDEIDPDATEEEIEAELEAEPGQEEAEETEEEIEAEEEMGESFKSFLRKGSLDLQKDEDLNATKQEIDKMAREGKDPEQMKAAIAMMADDDNEKEQAEKYAAEKLTESLIEKALATGYTASLANLSK